MQSASRVHFGWEMGGQRGSLVHFGVKLSAKCICVSFWVANRGKMGSLVLILGVKGGNVG